MTREKIIEEINNMANADVIGAWNECVQDMGYDYKVIYTNGPEVIDMLYDSPYDAILAVEYGYYSSDDEYVIINGNGNLESSNDWTNFDIVEIDTLADWIMDNPDKAKEYDIYDDDDEDE